MPLFTTCCGKDVPTKEPKICAGCGQRSYKTTLKAPGEGSFVWNGVSWEQVGRTETDDPPRRPAIIKPPSQTEGPLLAAVTPLQELTEELAARLKNSEEPPPPPPTEPATPEESEHEVSQSETVEVHGLTSHPQYNGCRGKVLFRKGNECVVQLRSNTIGGAPWKGSLGGRGSVPRHDRCLPWEQPDRHTTRMKDSYTASDLPPTTSLSIPGSFEMEATFYTSNLRVVKSEPSTSSSHLASAPISVAGTLSPKKNTDGKKQWYEILIPV
eukprot:TRINITY_DN14752_c0_g1_i2.p1 TRINITY_DN14752_c0_g1~~TRINITY_DN14752_c0_g1_i2.p1  ORF type:complete len:269 (+),score=32.11 TRINITY_DN14752_c0_g1_i2:60-866(+)